MRSFGFYLAALASFHTLEYLCTAMYRGDVKLSSFLINHSSAYHAAMAAGFLEYLIEYLYFPNLKQWRWWSWIGIYSHCGERVPLTKYYLVLLGLIAAQCLRSAAMVTAGSNFTHIISESKEHAHELVTRGVYSVFRHPSYTAFFYWGIFAQILLANPICAVAYGIALQQFFQDRIPYEEMKLMEFFEDYEIYRQRTKTYIPFVG
ncbi:Isoprenylcysteine carboxyl methyltransferase family-domain-containing protein [Phlyctochytrium arcticum]|nr:Isoprenylcysteine carboxyl methyltransferase family-domain-containing protein [Phlyctochytrium arcticum]